MNHTETVNGEQYLIGKLGVFEQLHVGRKLAPLLAHAIPGLLSIQGSDEKPDFTMLVFSAAAVPIAEVLCDMKKEDFDYVIFECLKVCQRQQAKGWAPILAGSVIMFQDIEADTVLALAQAVITRSLARFFPTSPTPSQQAPASPDSPQ